MPHVEQPASLRFAPRFPFDLDVHSDLARGLRFGFHADLPRYQLRCPGAVVPTITPTGWSTVHRELWGKCRHYEAGSFYDSFTLAFSSISQLGLFGWYRPNGTQTAYSSLIHSRSSAQVALGISGHASRCLTMQWNDSSAEWDANTGLVPSQGEMNLCVGFHSGATNYLWLCSPSLGIQIATMSISNNARSPSLWYLGTDPVAATTRNLVGDLGFAGIVGPEVWIDDGWVRQLWENPYDLLRKL